MKLLEWTRTCLSLVFLLTCFAFADSDAFAQLANSDLPNREGIKLGEIRAHSAMSTAEQLDTNIFLDNTDRKFDGITILSPSAGLELPLRGSSISADYRADIYLYNTFHSQNHIDQFVRALAEVPLLQEYIMTVKDTFSIVTSRANNENSSRIRQNDNKLRAGITADYDLLSFDVGYTNFLETYGSNDTIIGPVTYSDKDHFNHIVDITASYRFLPKTSAFLENLLGYIDYFKTSFVPNSVYEQVALGIKGEWFKKADINFKAGFRYQAYDNSNIIAHKDYVGAIVGGGLNFRPTERDDIAINLLRTVYESTYANMNFYIANSVGATYAHRFNDKVSANVFGAYELHQYPSESTENGLTAKRHDNYLRGGAGLRYDIRKWISAEARYEYVNRISKFDIFNYVDNQITFRGTIGF